MPFFYDNLERETRFSDLLLYDDLFLSALWRWELLWLFTLKAARTASGCHLSHIYHCCYVPAAMSSGRLSKSHFCPCVSHFEMCFFFPLISWILGWYFSTTTIIVFPFWQNIFFESFRASVFRDQNSFQHFPSFWHYYFDHLYVVIFLFIQCTQDEKNISIFFLLQRNKLF